VWTVLNVEALLRDRVVVNVAGLRNKDRGTGAQDQSALTGTLHQPAANLLPSRLQRQAHVQSPEKF
jgi:hypothetical protein